MKMTMCTVTSTITIAPLHWGVVTATHIRGWTTLRVMTVGVECAHTASLEWFVPTVSSTQRRRRRARHRNTSPVPLCKCPLLYTPHKQLSSAASDDQGPCPRRLSTIEDHPTTSPNSMTLTMQQRVADMRDQVHHADTSTTDHDSY